MYGPQVLTITICETREKYKGNHSPPQENPKSITGNLSQVWECFNQNVNKVSQRWENFPNPMDRVSQIRDGQFSFQWHLPNFGKPPPIYQSYFPNSGTP
jgi:hypothetical protein